jgi:pyruvate formate lyase activating enzyme
MKEAMFYQPSTGSQVICGLCHHRCHIKEGQVGICAVRLNRGGILYSLVYGKLVAEHIDPIEKKPLFHLLPGSSSYSISTVGCNFRCAHCQNFDISQYPHLHKTTIPGPERSPTEIVETATGTGCASISYTYVEPTIFYEYAYDCAVLAQSRGLRNIFVSNGYMTPEVSRHLAPVLSGINIDIKAFSELFYQKVCKARLAPVLENVKLFHELGVWVEITTLIIPGWNDSSAELRAIAAFIKEIDPSMPWHVTAFHPAFKMLDRPPTPVATLQRAHDIGLAEGLRHVYEGNVPGQGRENTYCPNCGATLVTRHGFFIQENLLQTGHCPKCESVIAGVWE